MDRLLAFDYDGVLVDSYDVFKRYFLEACHDQDVEAISTEEDFLSLFDGNLYESMRQQGLSRDQILRVVLAVRDGIMENREEIQLYPGIRETVHALAENHTLAVVTSNDTEVVRHLLAARDIDYFTSVIGSDREPSKHAKLQRLQRQHHGTCYYIGDTAGDIIEGKQADVVTVAATWGWHSEQRLRRAAPDHLVHTPEELRTLFLDNGYSSRSSRK
ncbi:MAG: HAD-IA family hydrolase [Thermoplasmatota archaeon]